MRTFNKRGDHGETSLLVGGRVSKSDPRCEAYGTLDEATSALGLARAFSQNDEVKQVILGLQRGLITVNAEIASAGGDKQPAGRSVVTAEMVDRLEALITELEGKVALPREFVLPGSSPSSAALDLARTMVRRAERRAVALREAKIIGNEHLLAYLNRLADLLFTLARYEESRSGAVEGGR